MAMSALTHVYDITHAYKKCLCWVYSAVVNDTCVILMTSREESRN
jgi:hypothetical protein